MSHLIAWYGLPGAGKSTELNKRYPAPDFQVFDDFMKDAIRDIGEFPFSRHFEDIVMALRRSEKCVIADIRLCESYFRREVAEILKVRVPNLTIEWHCFECQTANAVEICRNNVRYRSRTTSRQSEHALKSIAEFAPKYSIEPGACVYPVRTATGHNRE